jgi:hypothetical protein
VRFSDARDRRRDNRDCRGQLSVGYCPSKQVIKSFNIVADGSDATGRSTVAWGNQFMFEFSNRCPHRSVMIFRCIALISSLALEGCCVSGVSCAARAPGGGVAWDGLGPVPQENAIGDDSAPAGPQSASKRSRQQATRSDGNVRSGNQWEQEQASDQAADTKLTRQLKICSNC